MSSTLTYSDTIQRTGHTIVDGVKVVQYSCVLPLDHPENMRINSTQLNRALYKEHCDICRADYAEFENAAWKLQEQYMKKEE